MAMYNASLSNTNNEIILNGETITIENLEMTADIGMEFNKFNVSLGLPYDFYYGSAVVFDNEIHILGGSGGTTNHYKWNGSSWTSVSTLPYNFCHSSAVVLDKNIYIMGSSDSSTYKSWAKSQNFYTNVNIVSLVA